MTNDPICGMTVDEATALHAERDGQTFFFCSEHCRKTFLSTPATTKREEKKEQKPKEKAIYTCPMHPEVQQDHPGNCPKCGMALEPMSPTAGSHDEENTELRDMTRRFWIGAALTLPVFVLAMGPSDSLDWSRCLGDERCVAMDSIRPHHTRGGVGGLAVLPARLALHPDAALEHVHADRHRRGRSFHL
jgi:Cu+-exporting ATPase